MPTSDLEVSLKISTDKLRIYSESSKKVLRRKNWEENNNNKKLILKIIGVNFTHNHHMWKILMESRLNSFARKNTRKMENFYQ